MGFRFQRRIRLLPGVTLNLGKTGASASFGPRGFKHTVGPRGARTTFGLPGTGLSYTHLHRPDTAPADGWPTGYYDRRKVVRYYWGMAATTIVTAILNVKAPFIWWMPIGISFGGFLAWRCAKVMITPIAPLRDEAMPAGPTLNAPGTFDDLADRLHALDPLEFEQLVGALLTRIGYAVQTTPRSGDGGVDLFAEDPTPITGGRMVVQCKHTTTVGSPDVRDLYGTMTHHGCHKALLVTSGHFSEAAKAWAAGKPIELIPGDMLLNLIRQHR